MKYNCGFRNAYICDVELLGITNLKIELAAVIRPEPHPGRPVTSRKPSDFCGLLGKPFDQSLPFDRNGILFGTLRDLNECKGLFGCHVVLQVFSWSSYPTAHLFGQRTYRIGFTCFAISATTSSLSPN